MGKSKKKKKGGEFPDLTGDGKVTKLTSSRVEA